jgi:hypothetical protein
MYVQYISEVDILTIQKLRLKIQSHVHSHQFQHSKLPFDGKIKVYLIISFKRPVNLQKNINQKSRANDTKS